jgi:hypothetical protein
MTLNVESTHGLPKDSDCTVPIIKRNTLKKYREIATEHPFTASNCGFIHITAHHIKSDFIISLWWLKFANNYAQIFIRHYVGLTSIPTMYYSRLEDQRSSWVRKQQVNIYQAIQQPIQLDTNLHSSCNENLKFHIYKYIPNMAVAGKTNLIHV